MTDPHWTDFAVKVDSVQVSPKLRRGAQGHFHYCPGCQETHCLFDSWTFNGNLDAPTYSPSFKHTLRRGPGDERVCHYILTAGVLNFCSDSTHALAGRAVPLPDLPEHLRD